MSMEFVFEAHGDTTGVVVLSGRLDLLVAADMKARLQKLVADGWNRLVVDLHDVPFIDSSGLGAVIAGLKAARVAGGDFRIARPGEQIRHILQVSTLDRVLTPYNTVEEALAGYR
jgi:anti-sigma B factor antagonist